MPGFAFVLSPHLDDAVLGCGDWLAAHRGACVVTVFAGTPAQAGRLTTWDRAAGFEHAGQAIAARREEDRQALEHLGARPLWLDFRDAQYDEPASDEALLAALIGHEAFAAACTLVLPFGLFHDDHRQLARLAPVLVDRFGGDSLAYEDVPYRRLPGLLQQRLAQWQRAGLQATPQATDAAPDSGPVDAGAKGRAIACYRSQLIALATPGRPGHADASRPEGLWRLERIDPAGSAS